MKDIKKQSRRLGCLIALGVFGIIITLLVWIAGIEYLTYTDKGSGIRIKYPYKWTLYDKPEGGAIVAFVAPVEEGMFFAPNVNISFNDFSAAPMTPGQFSERVMFQLTKTFEPHIDVLESEPITLAGRPGHRFLYIGRRQKETGERGPMKSLHVWAVDGTQAYIITFAALESDYDKYIDAVEDMIRSFELL